MMSAKGELAEAGVKALGKLFGRGARLANKFDLPEAIPARGAKYVDNVADVIGGTVKSPRNILGIAKKAGKYGLGLTAGGALVSALLGKDSKPAKLPVDYGKINFGGTTADNTSAFDKYIANASAAINNAYANMPTYNVPGASMYDPMSGMVNQVGGASIAEMQRLANAAGQTGAGIQAGGAQGAGAINDIYGDLSGQMADLASYGGEYGAMTPVAGAMATAPTEAQMQGQNLADFLKQSQMITSQDAGFLAGLAPMLGSGYANELAMLDYAARQQAALRQQQMQQEMANERQQAQQNALLELALQGESFRLEDALKGQQNQGFINPADVEFYATQYDELIKNGNEGVLQAQGINSVEDFINRMISSSTGA
jgi:hypothetical protein